MRILIVDDEEIALSSLRRLLKRKGFFDVDICAGGREAISNIKDGNYDIVLLDILMPEVDGLQVLRETKPFKPLTEFIVLSAIDEVDTAVESIKMGAYDYLVKPVEPTRLFLSIAHAYERKGLVEGMQSGFFSKSKKIPEAFSNIVTHSQKMFDLISYAQVMARGGVPILISGESGTGKELMAHGIHNAGPVSEGPLVMVNVTSIPETLFESQFFGHAKGAFTGANMDHPGFFIQADGGTIFLDEIGELPIHLQPKLLRVLEEKSVFRVGDTVPIPVNVRLVSATNCDLDKSCQDGRFRLDLLYRIRSAHIHLPPLHERSDDIPHLADHFLYQACQRHNKRIDGFSSEALEMLFNKRYLGNIRELSQIVEHAVLLADSNFIQAHHLMVNNSSNDAQSPDIARRLCSIKENYYSHFAYVLQYTKGDCKRASEILDISLRQVQRKFAQMKKEPRWQSYFDDI